jgi:Na+-driven multidrug efflux pump
MTLAGATMALLRYPLMNAFNPDPKVVAIGAVLVLIAAVSSRSTRLG